MAISGCFWSVGPPMMMCVFNPQMVQLLGLGQVHHVEDQRCPKFGPEFVMIWALLFFGLKLRIGERFMVSWGSVVS